MCGFKGLVDLRASFDVVGDAKRSSFAVLDEYIHASGLYEMMDNIWGQRSATFPDSRRVFSPDTNGELRGVCSGRVTPSEDYGGAFEQRHSRNNYQDGGGHTQDPRPWVTGGTPDALACPEQALQCRIPSRQYQRFSNSGLIRWRSRSDLALGLEAEV